MEAKFPERCFFNASNKLLSHRMQQGIPELTELQETRIFTPEINTDRTHFSRQKNTDVMSKMNEINILLVIKLIFKYF